MLQTLLVNNKLNKLIKQLKEERSWREGGRGETNRRIQAKEKIQMGTIRTVLGLNNKLLIKNINSNH